MNASTITGNAASGGAFGTGGGAFNDADGVFTLAFSTVNGNTQTGPGPGADLDNNSGSATRHFTTVTSARNWPGSY